MSYWRLWGEQGRKLITITPVILITKCYCDKKKKELKIKVLKKFSYWLLAAVMVSSSNIHAVETKGDRGIMPYEGY